jgi:Ca-activated chloride channel homolog
MTWYRNIELWEYLFGFLFLVFNTAFAIRTRQFARILKVSWQYVFFKIAIRLLYSALILVSILGPSFGSIKQEVKALGKDIIFAVDVSQSMDSYDLPPSRLEKVRFELKNLLNLLEGDRLGLIVFTDEAFLQCPLTYDQGAIQVFIETLSTKIVNGGSTDLAAPLRLAIDKFSSSGTLEAAKTVVLISDGEDFGSQYESLLAELSKAKIRVFTVGVGTTNGGGVPTARGLLRDEGGKQVVTKLNPEPLSKIARATAGRYYELSDLSNGFPALGRDLQALQGQVVEVKKLDILANKYTYSLAIAILLLLIDILIPIRILRLKHT